MPKYIDIHAHTNFKAFEEDRDEVISRALENDTWIINVGSQFSTSKRAVLIADGYEKGVYAVVGLHPIHLEESYHDDSEIGGKGFMSRAEEFNENDYRELLKNPKVVGIGECGLDYFHMDEESIEKQKIAFIAQIELASELDLPLMLHVRNQPNASTPSLRATPQEGNLIRNAYADVALLLEKYSKRNIKGVSHFFAGSVEDMKRFIELGIYISFAGPITYKPRPEICDYESVIKATPLDMILADTDSPYVAPVPHRGTRNEPLYVADIVKKIAKIKELEEEEVAKIIVANARKLFGI